MKIHFRSYIYYLSPMLLVYKCLWPLRLVLMLVCCLFKNVYLQIFKYVSFWLDVCCGDREGLGRKLVTNNNSWVAVVTPTDRPYSIRKCCLIEGFKKMWSLCLFDIYVGIGVFVFDWVRSLSFHLNIYVLCFKKLCLIIFWILNENINVCMLLLLLYYLMGNKMTTVKSCINNRVSRRRGITIFQILEGS